MRRGTGLYSRVVAGLKIILPLAALSLLSTLFLFSRSTEEAMTVTLPGVTDTGEDIAEQVRGPSYSGVTDRGDLITLTARAAYPDTDGRVTAETVSGSMTLDDGTRIDLGAARAIMDSGSGETVLEGGVRIDSSQGYRLETDTLVTRLDGVSAHAPGPVTGDSPAGRIEAGAMRIERTPGADPGATDDDGPVQILFTGGVKLLYDPQAR